MPKKATDWAWGFSFFGPDQDMLADGLDVRKGEWTCVAAESLEDVSSDEDKDSKRTWLFIRKCQPLI